LISIGGDPERVSEQIDTPENPAEDDPWRRYKGGPLGRREKINLGRGLNKVSSNLRK
jgi:hypothetical protein